MLDVEAALARACAAEGLIEEAHAEAIAAACDAEAFDLDAVGEQSARGANPVIGLVEMLRSAVGEDVAPSVHLGATSQDVIDTAAMLVARRALEPILADAAGAAEAAATLAQTHRDTPMIGRTLLQQALPTTFGAKAAGWMSGIDMARRMVAEVAERGLAVQLGGAVGTRSAYAGRGAAVATAMAQELGLCDPPLPWHGDRVRVGALAGSLALLAGALAKPARDVALLAQDEVGEAAEAAAEGVGGSSAMAHKRNPVAAVSALACAERVPGLVATIHGAMAGEHERAAGAWHTEWETLSDALRLTGSAAAWTRSMIEGLEVDVKRMEANLTAATAADAGTGEAGVLVDAALARHRERGA